MKAFPSDQRAPPRKLIPETHVLEVETEPAITDLVQQIRNVFSSPTYRPPSLPTVAVDLMAMSRRPNVEVKELVSLLERDALLSAQVLQRSNSVFYAGQMPTLSLKQAVTRLGLATLRDIVLEAALNLRVFRVEGYADFMEKLRMHCSATAHLARHLCRYSSFEGDYAFMCGLLHDVGIAATLIALNEATPKDRPSLESVLPAVIRTHEETSAHVLTLWKLPAELAMVINHHHQAKIAGHPHPLVATVALAEHLATEAGFGGTDEQPAMPIPDACRAIGMNPAQWNLAKQEATKVIEEMRKPAA
jgi:putative nucleotidyltransferase with HDIG domain